MGLKRKIIAVSLCLIMMLGCINVNVIDAKASSFTLSANNDNSANDGLGAVDLDWSTYTKKNVMFKGYQSKDNGITWQSISLMDYTCNLWIDSTKWILFSTKIWQWTDNRKMANI